MLKNFTKTLSHEYNVRVCIFTMVIRVCLDHILNVNYTLIKRLCINAMYVFKECVYEYIDT